MGVISKHKDKITFYYNSETSLGERTLPYIKAADKDLLAIDISKTQVTGTQWSEIADGLGLKVADLIDKNHKQFMADHGDSSIDMNTNSWIKVLQNQPETLAFSIVVTGATFHAIKSPGEFVKFISYDSAQINQNSNEAQ